MLQNDRERHGLRIKCKIKSYQKNIKKRVVKNYFN